ncbi:MAG: right-handed parallel beta-helix repeat-containing protein [Phycisphaerales bacterium]|nr:right-handed parallel beta-helix repeat-containing protein [Phycisphaerae bacterium]NNF42792.1 right-handed parallel beta-helix repeat-containing protein [Phycisphaerales bacterium]NNM27703.1 right-handed parallel beta-helix repeat-containing protein [Phycisphaerales bacterium]
MRPPRRFISMMALALSASVWPSAPSVATHHLISPGERWETLAEKIKPGDELILMPGKHRAARFDTIVGEADAPVIVRSADPANPAVIHAERYGIEIGHARHVQIRDLSITGATINGVRLGSTASGDDEKTRSRIVHLANLKITKTGRKGQRHAVYVEHTDRLTIEGLVIESWAGSGIEIVGCTEVRIEGCTLRGDSDPTPAAGIRVRGGSDRVRIDKCELTDTGDQGIAIGGLTKLDAFDPPLDPAAEAGSLTEASRVHVSRCVIRNGLCAVSFVNAERSSVSNCTLLRPRRTVLSIRRDQTDPRFASVRNCTFGSNLIVWEPGDLASLGHIGPATDDATVYLEENLWWSSDLAEAAADLGAFPGEEQFAQLTELDPALDDTLKPTVASAELFGAHAP